MLQARIFYNKNTKLLNYICYNPLKEDFVCALDVPLPVKATRNYKNSQDSTQQPHNIDHDTNIAMIVKIVSAD